MRAHPAADLFPLMSDAELEELARDIEQHGQQVPIVVFENRILDGRNRARACAKLGIEPRVVVQKHVESPASFVLSANLHRRHLSAAQKAAVAVLAKDAFVAEAKVRQKAALNRGPVRAEVARAGRGDHEGRWSTQAARATGAGSSAVKALDRIRRAAPEVFEAVRAGTVKSVRDAGRVAELPARERGQVLERLREKPATSARTHLLDAKRARVLKALPKGGVTGAAYELHHGDLSIAVDHVPPRSAGLVFADPPHDKDALALYPILGELAVKLLRPGGSFVVIAGQAWLPEILGALQKAGLNYQWLLAYNLSGNEKNVVWDRRLLSEWKAVAWFTNGKYRGKRVLSDLLIGSTQEKDLHQWQQPLADITNLVTTFSEVGELVIDPMCGTGTAGVACLREGRRFVGVDQDRKMLKIAASRLGAERSTQPGSSTRKRQSK